ncbi:MAG: peptide MFS transporter [Chitinophagales bacterium]|jgi:POT family proton-dependent oligopeptide transporter|nr:peptide MFS transporter [Chitinophagales bacterium]
MNFNLLFIFLGVIFSAFMILSVYRINKNTHPKVLWLLFFTEMWERFSFYGMRALLIMYLTKIMLMQDKEANMLYASYNALVYTFPMFGGWIADNFLGYRKTIILGGTLMCLGHFSLAFDDYFFLGLSLLILGNGFFKPNISSLLGSFYEKNDLRKDSAYSIFYMGVNIGAFLGSMACGYLGGIGKWHYGFGLAGLFMFLGLIVFVLLRDMLQEEGHEPNELSNQVHFGLKSAYWFYLSMIPILFLVYHLNKIYELTTIILIPFGLLTLIYFLVISYRMKALERNKFLTAIVLTLCSVVFFGIFEQSGGSLNLMASRNVDFNFLGTTLESTMMNNSINPFYIVLLTPFLDIIFRRLAKNGKNLSIPLKFSLSFLIMAIGYSFFYFGAYLNLSSGMIPLGYFMLAYLFITISELFISPIGLSMISKLVPTKMVALMMGFWFLASAIGHKFAGYIGTKMSIQNFDAAHYNPIETLPIYVQGLQFIIILALSVFAFTFIIKGILEKQIKDNN